MELVIVNDVTRGCTVVRLSGELDISSAPNLREQLLVILDRQAPSCLVLDLSKLDFVDSSGIAVFVNTQRRARLLGCTLMLVAPRAAVLRVLQICGLEHHFPILQNVSAPGGTGEAAAAIHASPEGE
jgi:anti-sigma B factor antagonist